MSDKQHPSHPTDVAADFSAGLMAVTPQGFPVTLHWSAERVQDLRKQAEIVGQALLKAGWTPAVAPIGEANRNVGGVASSSVPQPQAETPPPPVERFAGPVDSDGTPICPVHGKRMKQVSGRRGAFWSCGTKLSSDPDVWCEYRPQRLKTA